MVLQRPEKTDIFKLALGCEIAPLPAFGVQDSGAGRGGQNLQAQHAAHRQGGLPGAVIKVQQLWRRRFVNRIHPVAAAHRLASCVVLIGDPRPTRGPLRLALIVQHHRGGGQIIEQRFQPVMKKAQPMFHPGMFAPGRNRLIEWVIGAARTKFDAVILPEPGNRGRIQHHLADRSKIDLAQLFGGALADRVESPCALQHIAEQIQPHRPSLAGGEDIDDPAANGIIARL